GCPPTSCLRTGGLGVERTKQIERPDSSDCSIEHSVQKMPAQLAMKGGKVYTGVVLELPVPITRLEGGCIEFLPVSSGYRSAETQDVVITTDYAQVIADLTKPAKADDGSEKKHGPTVVPETETVTKEAGRGPGLQKDWNRLVTLKKAVP